MLAPRLSSQIVLEARGVHRVTDGAGLTILCLKGTIWVTQQNDRRDVVLGAGESFILDRPGLALMYALSSACATILSRARPRLAEHAGEPRRIEGRTGREGSPGQR
jgi:Protein of unknown function (DUF2917)